MLFNSASLKNLLGGKRKTDQNISGSPQKPKPLTKTERKEKEDEHNLIMSIIQEETGVTNPKRMRQSFRKREKKQQAMTSVAKGGLERARLNRLQQNNVYTYAADLSMSRDDVRYLDSQQKALDDCIFNNSAKIRLAYKHFVEHSDADSRTHVISREDARALLNLIQHPLVQTADFDSSQLNFPDDSSEAAEPGQDDGPKMLLDDWLGLVENTERVRLLAGMLAEQQGLAPGFMVQQYVRWRYTHQDESGVDVEEEEENEFVMDTEEEETSHKRFLGGTMFPPDSNTLTLLDFMTEEMYNVGDGDESVLRSKSQPELGKPSVRGKKRGGDTANMNMSMSLVKSRTIRRRLSNQSTGGAGGTYKKGGRETPRVLRNASEGPATIQELRSELYRTRQGLDHLNSVLEENIQWVHSNCDAALIKGNISAGARQKCQKIAADQFCSALGGYLLRTQWTALRYWQRAIKCEAYTQFATTFSRLRGLESMTRVVSDGLIRQYLRCWRPWVRLVMTQQRWEQESAAMIMQCLVRGKLGRCRYVRLVRARAAIVVQCMFRRMHAHETVRRRKIYLEYLRLYNASKKIQRLFDDNVQYKRAKVVVARKRQEKAAVRIQKIHRGGIGRRRFCIKRDQMLEANAARAEVRARAESEAKAAADKAKSMEQARLSMMAQFEGADEEPSPPATPSEERQSVLPAAEEFVRLAADAAGDLESKPSSRGESRGASRGDSPDRQRAYQPVDQMPQEPEHLPQRGPGGSSKQTTVPVQAPVQEPEPMDINLEDYMQQAPSSQPSGSRAASTRGAGVEAPLQASALGSKPGSAAQTLGSKPGSATQSLGSKPGSAAQTLGSKPGSAAQAPVSRPPSSPPPIAVSPVPNSGLQGSVGLGSSAYAPPSPGNKPPTPSSRPSSGVVTRPRSGLVDRISSSIKSVMSRPGTPSRPGSAHDIPSDGNDEEMSSAGRVASMIRSGLPSFLGGNRSPSAGSSRSDSARGSRPSSTTTLMQDKPGPLEPIMSEARLMGPPDAGQISPVAESPSTSTTVIKRPAASPPPSSKLAVAVEAKQNEPESAPEPSQRPDSRSSAPQAASRGASPESVVAAPVARPASTPVAAPVSKPPTPAPIAPQVVLAPTPERDVPSKPTTAQKPVSKPPTPVAEQQRPKTQTKAELELEPKPEPEPFPPERVPSQAVVPNDNRGSSSTPEASRPASMGLNVNGDSPLTPEASRPASGATNKPMTAASSGRQTPVVAPAEPPKEEQKPGMLGQLMRGLSSRGPSRPSTASVAENAASRPTTAAGEPTPESAATHASSAPEEAEPFENLKASPPQPKADFVRPDIPDVEAAARLQQLVRRFVSSRRVAKKRRQVRDMQRKVFVMINWAVVTMQRAFRGKIGRMRFVAHAMAKSRDRDTKKGICVVRIQRRVRGMIGRQKVRRLLETQKKEQLRQEYARYNKDKLEKQRRTAEGDRPTSRDGGRGHSAGGGGAALSEEEAAKVRAMDAKLKKLEEMEAAIMAKAEAMDEANKAAEARAASMEKAFKELQDKAAQEEADRLARKQMLEMAAGPIATGRSSFEPGTGRGSMMSTRQKRGGMSARSAPPTARSARGGAAITPDTIKLKYKGEDWAKLWDPDEKAWYWYNEATQAAQWDMPGEEPEEYGYSSGGALTDYSTDAYGESGGEITDGDTGDAGGGAVIVAANGSQWSEFWDEAAQAKYWYNYATGEAVWAKPEAAATARSADVNSARSTGRGPMATGGGAGGVVAASARDGMGDWASYIDEQTGQEYWYNTATGETSWA